MLEKKECAKYADQLLAVSRLLLKLEAGDSVLRNADVFGTLKLKGERTLINGKGA